MPDPELTDAFRKAAEIEATTPITAASPPKPSFTPEEVQHAAREFAGEFADPPEVIPVEPGSFDVKVSPGDGRIFLNVRRKDDARILSLPLDLGPAHAIGVDLIAAVAKIKAGAAEKAMDAMLGGKS